MTRLVYTDLVETAVDLTLDEFNHRVLATAACTITLPTAIGASVEGREYSIKAAVNGVTVDTTSSQTIDGDLTKELSAGACLVVFSDGANWRIG